jgi:MFS family permease
LQYKSGLLKKETIWTQNFILLALGNLLMATSFYFLIPTLPIYIEQLLKADKSTTGLVLASYSIAALIIRPFTGMALDNLGRKTIFLFSFALFAILFNAYIFAFSITFMLVLRFFHGTTWGMVSTSNATVVVDILPPARRGEGIGIFGLSMTFGMAIGPALGLAISNNLSYRDLFLFGGLLAMAGFFMALSIKYPKFTVHPDSKGFSWKNLLEKKSLPAAFNMLILMITYGGLLSFVAIYGKEIGIKNPGVFFITYAAGIGISRFFSGKIFDRRGPLLLNYTGMSLLVIGFAVLALVQNISGFMISAVIIGLGNGIIMPTLQAMVNNLVPAERRGAANSTYFSAVDLGIGAGMILMGILGDVLTLSQAYFLSSGIAASGVLFCILITHPHYKRNKL